jgi:acid phosphatase type 7
MGANPRILRSRATHLLTALAAVWFGLVGVPSAQAGSAVLVGAGDIADCGSSGDAATAALLRSIGGTVFTLGDNVYEDGTAKQFENCYGPTWGQVKGRTRPAIGNHEYQSKGAAGYWDYFGKAAGPRGKGWYSYDAGSWHVVVLNANCDKVGCGKGSEQERWLRADLAAHDNQCTLAYWHQARFVSDKEHGNHAELGPFWEALYDYGSELVLSGHAHVYERFAPQTPSAKADPDHGIREIIVGTGGESHYQFGSPRPNSQVRNANTFGVLKLTLQSGSYDWQFIPQKGKSFRDSGHTSCHGRP